ncbi:4-hydroxybenzoate-octaprenyltransferase [Legionella beliardensis]|uniref:4-hydroxybenzoate octaprenyltransferase n=1 Tax=Legionella beliardensis TaxID=91822 RepID=A0A378I2P0_9GAMM|nr:4-hydroxybenzoate octaprenyltransferase [Legionella beliardensis]STX28936.1 4-hydroxybenzoate-octaprenyltransferase [Legionella beliardensis]
MNWNSYYRLARFHKPVGILLLWSPTAWALWVANQGNPPIYLLILFLLGTVFMRAAGCIMNDIADRNIDLHVKRTCNRPLTAGEVGLNEAITLLISFLVASLIILIQLPVTCFYYALFALLVTFIYPFCKRFIQGPQLVLGIAFSLGIPMAFVASNSPFNKSIFYLLLINYAWIIAYDTQYAIVDRKDDLRIGVKSTAILFANYDRLAVGFLQLFFHTLWIPLVHFLNLRSSFFSAWVVGAIILIYQQWLTIDRNEEKCLNAFSWNGWYGLIMWLAIILGYNV